MKKAKLFGIMITCAFAVLLAYTLAVALMNWGNFAALNNPNFWYYTAPQQDATIAGVNVASISSLLAVPCGILMMLGIMLSRKK